MTKIIGIDLGTGNSCISAYENGEAKIIINSSGNRTTPSVVAFKGEEILVGEVALRQGTTNPSGTFYEVKRLIGRKFNDKEVQEFKNSVAFNIVPNENGDAWVEADGKKYSPQEISAKILAYLKKVAEDYLGEEVKEAVITCPAYFNDAQRQATRDAGVIAGLDVKRIVNEPTAASLAYGIDSKEDKNVVIVDFGSGTYDVSLLSISSDGVFEVIATAGNTFLGGSNLDERIINFLADEFKKECGIDVRKDNLAMARLKESAEKAKKELSNVVSTNINIPFITADQDGPKHLNIELSRAKFESLVSDLIEKLVGPCQQVLNDSGLRLDEIAEVVLVGGSTRIPLVQEKVKQIFGKEPSKGVNPDEVVALGAAIQGGVLSGDVNDILLLDVAPLSLSIETNGGISTVIIERNTTIPVQKSQVFSTASDSQSAVDIKVLQGERQFAKDNKLLGNFTLGDIAPAPRGVPQIEVSFDVDANGIINVSAKDLSSGKEASVEIKDGSGLSEEEISRMVNEAETNKEADEVKKELMDKRNELDSIIHLSEKQIEENKDKLPEELVLKIENALSKAKQKLVSENIEELSQAIEALQQVIMELAQAQEPKDPGMGSVRAEASKNKDDILDADFKEV